MFALVTQCFAELQARDKTPITLQSRSSATDIVIKL